MNTCIYEGMFKVGLIIDDRVINHINGNKKEITE